MGHRIGLALGSGGAKGYAHIGVIKALEAYHISIDVISGSSMGSLVGAFYVTGMTPSFMEKLAINLHWRQWMDFTVPKIGLIQGDKVQQLVALLTQRKSFADTNRPFAVVATNLLTRRLETFVSGELACAVRASISIPGVFVPYTTASGIYIDGGVLERVPVTAARKLGADIVIGIDVSAIRQAHPPENMIDVILQSIDLMQDETHASHISSANLCIEPNLGHIGTSQFHKAGEAIEIGYQAVVEALPKLRLLTQQCAQLHESV